MKKLVGYIISILGLAVLVVGVGVIKITSEILNSISSFYILGLGIGLVILGVVVVMLDKDNRKIKNKQSEEEVPIYEGTGKKRKIVGYRRS